MKTASKKDIINLPNPHLRTSSKRVAVINDKLKRVIDDMKNATLDWEASRQHELGVALAGVQIDQPYRIIIVRNNLEDKNDKSFSVFINPEIVKTEGELEEDYEGCLSIKDIYGKVPRYQKVRVKALDENGHEVRLRAEGFLARVFQHEIDHLKGIVFTDRIKDIKSNLYRITDEGELEKTDYEEIAKTGIFR